MELRDFIEKNSVDYSYNRVSESFLPEMESLVGVKLGDQLKEYILRYGYLGYKHVELFGVNNAQTVNSDMIKRTVFLHERFGITAGLIAVEDQGDGDYYMVDPEDKVYRFTAGSKVPVSTGLCLNEYILKRFLSV